MVCSFVGVNFCWYQQAKGSVKHKLMWSWFGSSHVYVIKIHGHVNSKVKVTNEIH